MHSYNDELYHWGIKGMKWGVRRYQNKDGTLTAAGRSRYVGSNAEGTDEKVTKESWAFRQTKKGVENRRSVSGCCIGNVWRVSLGKVWQVRAICCCRQTKSC